MKEISLPFSLLSNESSEARRKQYVSNFISDKKKLNNFKYDTKEQSNKLEPQKRTKKDLNCCLRTRLN